MHMRIVTTSVHAYHYITRRRVYSFIVFERGLSTDRPRKPLEFLLQHVIDQAPENSILKSGNANHAGAMVFGSGDLATLANDFKMGVFAMPPFPLVVLPSRCVVPVLLPILILY